MMLPLGTEVPMYDGTWTITDRRFVLTLAGQVEMYTLERAHYELRLTRAELEANKITH